MNSTDSNELVTENSNGIKIGIDKLHESQSRDEMYETASGVLLQDDCNKENIKKASRKRKTTKEQLQKIDDFHKEYNEDLIDKGVYNDIWNSVCDDLNLLGPPSHSPTEWKKVWTSHKHNEKKKRLLEGSFNIGRTTTFDQSSSNSISASPQSIQIIQVSSDTVVETELDFHSNVMSKLDVISQKLDKIIEKQDLLDKKIEKR